MNSDTHNDSRTALVLGGGGSTGNAWLIGVIAGLFEAGVDVTGADLLVGTSAGSTAAAQITGATPAELFGQALTVVAPRRPGPVASGPAASGPVASGPARDASARVEEHLDRMRGIVESSVDAADMRRRMGAAALERDAESDGAEERSAQWRATVATRLPGAVWPDRKMLITAVDARTGEPVVFDRHSGVDLVDAVAASCSSGFAYRVGDMRYIDGGYRSNAENADLAAGYARILVLAPFGGRELTSRDWTTPLATQLVELRSGGSRVELIVPGDESGHLFGVNAMHGALRPPAARVGHEQGRESAERVAGFWL